MSSPSGPGPAAADIGELDLHLFAEGRHRRLWKMLGAMPVGGGPGHGGVRFAVWAPNAGRVDVIGDWNDWSGDSLESIGAGVWAGRVGAAREGNRYRYRLELAGGDRATRADPMAAAADVPPGTASVVTGPNRHEWSTADWRERRSVRNAERLSVYEVHAGSWRRHPDGRPHGYRELAEPLAAHVAGLGFTHVELMPLALHPFGGSWGYQVTGYYAPDPRGGSADDLRFLVDTLHSAGVGVIVDWVPAHFPRDEGGLARFDGTALYEHEDPRRGEHPDWGTLVFNHGRHEVREFLVANALWWLEEFRVDGLRVDAVASMLYLDYSRAPGEWEPNVHGGREDLDAVAFVRELNSVVAEEHPGALVIAEESTAWPGVTAPVDEGGLGFSRKWNLGWMHDTLGFLEREPVHRRFHHGELVFPMHYAFDERWVLPLSHDEVVHGKRSLLGRMPGDEWQRLANLRCLFALQWSMPGSPLLFMGGELAQEREWSHDREIDWSEGAAPGRSEIAALVADLNRTAEAHPALWRGDDVAGSAWWLDADRVDESTFAFGRYDPVDGGTALCIANLTPVPRPGYRVGLPSDGHWSVVLSTDDPRYGGTGHDVGRPIADPDTPWQGQDRSAVIGLPPLAMVWIASPAPA